MSSKKSDLVMSIKVFVYIAAVTASVLSIPYIAMQMDLVKPEPSNPLDQGVNWTLSDFLVMGVILFGVSSLFVLVARVSPKKYRTTLGIGFLLGFLWLWAELAVGIFTNWGS